MKTFHEFGNMVVSKGWSFVVKTREVWNYQGVDKETHITIYNSFKCDSVYDFVYIENQTEEQIVEDLIQDEILNKLG